jgi:Domain of unknown function (DUF222)
MLAARISAALERLDAAADGSVSVAQWLRSTGQRSASEAGALAKRADRLMSCPRVADAWLGGRLSTGQVDAVVARVTDWTQAMFAVHEPELVTALAGLSVRDTELAMRHWAAYASALVEAPLREPSDRSVYLAAGPDGWGELTGRLDPSGTQVVQAALDPAGAPDVAGEPARTPRQRRADALVAVARHYLDHAEVAATSRGRRPDVTVVMTVDDLERRAGRSLDGAVLDAAAVGALLCDAMTTRRGS